MTSPTARTIDYLKKEGWPLVDIVERRKGRFVSSDMFGFVDLVAFHPARGWLLVQTTSGDHVAHRLTKIKTECREAAAILLQNSLNRIVVIGWRTVKVGKVRRWQPRIEEVTLSDLTKVSQ